MRLKVGDKLYLNPDKIRLNEKNEYTFVDTKYSKEELIEMSFKVTSTRDKTIYGNGDDICVEWIDGTDWWWGQIGETEPWTIMFINETQYLRNRKLEEIGI